MFRTISGENTQETRRIGKRASIPQNRVELFCGGEIGGLGIPRHSPQEARGDVPILLR